MRKFKRSRCTIAIPAHGSRKWIEECLDSIPEGVRILVGVDACSDTMEALHGIGDRRGLNVYFSESNVGPCLIRNTLCSLADTEWVFFLDSDDYLAENAMNTLEASGKSDIKRFRYLTFQNDEEDRKYSLEMNNKIKYAHGCFAVRRDTFIRNNGFQPWFCLGDTEFMFRVDKAVGTAYIEEPVFVRRYSSGSLSKNACSILGKKRSKEYRRQMRRGRQPRRFHRVKMDRII